MYPRTVPDDDRKDDPNDAPSTPIHSTGTYPVFRQTAEDLAKRLDKFRDPDAWLMAGELRYFAEVFASWSPTTRPSEETRSQVVSDYLRVYRRALDYIVRTSLFKKS